MLLRNFRNAAKGHGEYCTAKNELRVRRGRKIYRFICDGDNLWFAAPGQQDVLLCVSPDVTAKELRHGIPGIIDEHERSLSFAQESLS